MTLTLSEPITAALIATLLLQQHIGAAGWIGVATVMAALVITARGAKIDASHTEPITPKT